MMHAWFLSFTVFSCFLLTIAVKCREKVFGISEVYMKDDYETKTCEGDFCLVGGRVYESRTYQLCLSGASFSELKPKCWNNKYMSYCICNTDYCTDKLRLQVPSEGNLTCANQTGPWISSDTSLVYKDCFACKVSGCADTNFNDIEEMLQPQSCVRLQTTNLSASTYCVCDTGDYCAGQLVKEQLLNAETVTCFVGSAGNETCKGQYCFIEQGPTIIVSQYFKLRSQRGCITNNETLFKGLYRVGYMRSLWKEFVVCNSERCNSDWDTASRSIPVPSSTTAQTPIKTATTTNSLKESLFEIEYMKLFSSIKTALDIFINRYAEIQG